MILGLSTATTCLLDSSASNGHLVLGLVPRPTSSPGLHDVRIDAGFEHLAETVENAVGGDLGAARGWATEVNKFDRCERTEGGTVALGPKSSVPPIPHGGTGMTATVDPF
jgi:hypothetical protein